MLRAGDQRPAPVKPEAENRPTAMVACFGAGGVFPTYSLNPGPPLLADDRFARDDRVQPEAIREADRRLHAACGGGEAHFAQLSALLGRHVEPLVSP